MVTVTMKIEGLHYIAAGETLEIYADGLCIRIHTSSPVREEMHDDFCIGNDHLQAYVANDCLVGAVFDDDVYHHAAGGVNTGVNNDTKDEK